MAGNVRLILFSSTYSQLGREAESLLGGVPGIRIVKLDTKEQREHAASGRNFSITSVPVFVAQHPNGKIDVWDNIQKIRQLAETMKNGNRPASRGREDRGDRRRKPPPEEGLYGPRKPAPKRRPERDYSEEESSYEEDEGPSSGASLRDPEGPIVYEESSDEESPVEEEPKKKKKSVSIKEPTKKLSKSEGRKIADRKLKQAKKDRSEVVPRSTKKGREEANKKLAAIRRASSKKGPGKMKAVLASAKEAEAAFKAALGD